MAKKGGEEVNEIALGLLMGFGVGALARALDIPSPAPPKFYGALLVVTMSSGYVAAQWVMAQW